jgi:HTH-type transcriptional regulator / antitoxin HigA
MSTTQHDYGELLSQIQPEVIHGEERNQFYIDVLEKLTSKPTITSAEQKLIELLVVLVKNYESEHNVLPQTSPIDIVKHLMEAHGLHESDMSEILGDERTAREVLGGSRDLSKDQIQRLSARFGISPAAFF